MRIPSIWANNEENWKLIGPKGFSNEATLQELIEKTPEMLPLAGSPRIVVIGREVQLGSGYADLVGVETSGRPVIIEVKLASNNEARRAVVAQILAYAASLHGMTPERFEGLFGDSHQVSAGTTLVDAVQSAQEETLDADEFTETLETSLDEGRFRLVFVLDSVPQELTTLVAYLEHVTDKLLIDLVAVNAFDVSGTTVVVPQRVTPERHEVSTEASRQAGSQARYFIGSEEFEDSIDNAAEEHQALLRRLLQWARDLEQKGLVQLRTSEGVGGRRYVLNPILVTEGIGLVSIFNQGGGSISFWRSVFERNAPGFIEQVEELTGATMGHGTGTRDVTEDLLSVLTEAYEQAAS